MLPDLESLRCFEAAATLLNFRAAADRVALSPAAFSDRIRRLEEQAGCSLFTRTTRAVALTEEGLRLLPRARTLLEGASQIFAAARGGGPQPVELTLGTRYELGLSWLIPALPRLERAQPDRTLHLRFGEGPDLLARLRQGELDAAITSARLAEGAFDFATLHPESYRFVGAARLLAAHPCGRPEDAASHTLLDLDPGLPLFRYLRDATETVSDWRFRRVEYLGTIAALRLRALQGRGLAVLPSYFVEADLKAGRLVRVLPRLPLRSDAFRLLWRRDHLRAPALRRLAEELRAMPLK